MPEPLLALRGVCKSFGAVRSLVDVDLVIAPSSVVGLIGPNGAGKSTLINILTGVYQPDSGSVIFGGKDLVGVSTAQRARLGLVRTFQRPSPIVDLSAIEGVMVGGLVRGLSRTDARAEAQAHLARLGLRAEAERSPRTLPTGRLKLLDFARVLMLRPKLVLLDELMSGLSGGELEIVLDTIDALAAEGIVFLVVEHLMEVIQRLSRSLVVMDAGSVIAHGPPEQVVRDRRVVEAYLGSDALATPC